MFVILKKQCTEMIEMGFSGHSEKYWLIYVVAKKQHPLFQFRGIWLG
jgi:hypothetical protein